MHDEYPPGSHEWAFGKLDPETKKRYVEMDLAIPVVVGYEPITEEEHEKGFKEFMRFIETGKLNPDK